MGGKRGRPRGARTPAGPAPKIQQKPVAAPKSPRKEASMDSPKSSVDSSSSKHVDEADVVGRQPPGLFTPVNRIQQSLQEEEARSTTAVLSSLARQIEKMQEVQGLMLQKMSTTQQSTLGTTPSMAGGATSMVTPAVQGLKNVVAVDTLQPAELRAFSPIEGVSDTTLKAALKGEFVYLDQFLLNLIVSPENDGELCQYIENGQVNFRPRRSKRKITNFSSWMEAWGNYERLMTRYHGLHEVYEQMADYRTFISECDRKYAWSAVAAYDIRHRAKLSRKSVNFSNVDISLQAQLLDASSVKTNAPRCYRCRSFQHNVAECPFPQSATQKSASQKADKKKEVCRNFNNLKCVISNCPRQHVCKSCGGELPYELCLKSGPCQVSS